MANNIKEYIEENIDEINTFQQDGVEWINHFSKTLNSEETKKHEYFINAINTIRENLPDNNPLLNREKVREFYSDIYTGFVATLLWGHIFHTHLQTIISIPKEEILSKLNDMFDGFKTESPGKVFKEMLKGDKKHKGKYHIEGISVSFFTKIFYFTSHIHGYKNLLILDGKMWDAYNAFLRVYGEDVKKFNNCQYEDYEQYCNYMRSIPSVKRPEQLEAFLFTHNNDVKSFLGSENTQATKKQRSKPPRIAKRHKKDIDNEWKPYKTFTVLDGRTNGMELVKSGYCLPLKNIDNEIEQYRIFVAKHTSGAKNGQYFCKIEKGWGLELGNIENNPDAYKIIHVFSKNNNIIKKSPKNKWVNSGKNGVFYNYKYLEFDANVTKEEAVSFMEGIINYVQNTLNN